MYVCQALQIVGFPLGSSLMKPSFWFTLEVMWLMCELKVMYYDRITPRYLGFNDHLNSALLNITHRNEISEPYLC